MWKANRGCGVDKGMQNTRCITQDESARVRLGGHGDRDEEDCPTRGLVGQDEERTMNISVSSTNITTNFRTCIASLIYTTYRPPIVVSSYWFSSEHGSGHDMENARRLTYRR